MFSVGDKVQYVPHVDHAAERMPDGTYPWTFGLQDRKGEVEELTDGEADGTLRRAGRQRQKSSVVPVRPKSCWPATVTAVNPDGTVNADITNLALSGVTLHVSNLPVKKGMEPHSILDDGPTKFQSIKTTSAKRGE